MDGEKYREVSKPPRRPVGDLQKLPTYPWMFSWPMRAEERLLLTNGVYYGNYPCAHKSHTSYPYKRHWQFRDHTADSRLNPMFFDLRGGPSNIRNVTDYSPSPTPFRNIHARFEHLRLERLDKRVWDEWMRQYGDKYFYMAPPPEND